jgi:ParB/RepB/Spo0J family partition protein
MKVSDIVVGENFSREEVGDCTSLAHSIQQVGLLAPLLIDKNRVLVAGFRRYHAVKNILGWEEAEVSISETDKLGLSNLMENLERQELTFYEEAYALRRLFVGMEYSEIAKTLSMSATWVRRRMRFWELPAECIQLAKQGKLTVNQIADLIDSKDPLELLAKIRGLSSSDGRRSAGKTSRPPLKEIKTALTECVARGCNDAAQALLYAIGDITEEQFFDSIGRD